MARNIGTDANISKVRLAEQASDPATPASGFGKVYAKTDGKIYFINDAGTVYDLTLAGYARIVTVAKSGGDYTTIQGAINSITDAASNKRYLVRVMPGLYAEQVTMKSWVDVRGAGKHATRIQYEAATGAVILADYVQLEDILIESTDSASAWAIVGTNVSDWHIRNVDILSDATSRRAQGLKVTGSTWNTGFIEHGVWNIYTQTGNGVYLTGNGQDIDVSIVDLFLDTFEATTGGGVLLDNVADIQIRESMLRTATAGYNIKTQTGGSLDIYNSFIEFGTSGIEIGASTTVRAYNTAASSYTNSGTLVGEINVIAASNTYKDIWGVGSGIGFYGTPGGGGEAIFYLDSGSAPRTAFSMPGSDIVALHNRASNGVVQIRANTSTAGAGGEITAVEVQDDGVDFLDPDVAHGITDFLQTTAYGRIQANSGTTGGLRLVGADEGSVAFVVQAYSNADDTTKSTAGVGSFVINTAKRSGTGVGNVGADANIWVLRMNDSTRAIIDEDGDLHLDATSNQNVWDEYDDVGLINGLRAMVMTDGAPLKDELKKWVEYARPILEKTGVVTFNDDGHHFISMKSLNMLIIDTMRQMHQRNQGLEERLANMESKMSRLMEST